MIIKIAINELKKIDKIDFYEILAQKDVEVLTYIKGDINELKIANIAFEHASKENISGFKDISRGKIINKKSLRDFECQNIEVALSQNIILDGDEISQDRLIRAISSMSERDTKRWKCSDNSFALLNKNQLKEALVLANKKQEEIWFKWG